MPVYYNKCHFIDDFDMKYQRRISAFITVWTRKSESHNFKRKEIILEFRDLRIFPASGISLIDSSNSGTFEALSTIGGSTGGQHQHISHP